MSQEINNNGSHIESQLNIANNTGPIYVSKQSRFSKRFEKLNAEVATDVRYNGVMEDFKYYITKLDGVEMASKLSDGGFNESEIIEATRRKEKYAKKLEINRFFESAQWIDSQLFAKIKINFEAYVEKPLINGGASKKDILRAVVEYVIIPVLDIINIEGESDEVLNYNAEDIYGMVYFLTGKCHINWKNYDSI